MNTSKKTKSYELQIPDSNDLNIKDIKAVDNEGVKKQIAVVQEQHRLGWDEDGFHMNNHGYLKNNLSKYLFPSNLKELQKEVRKREEAKGKSEKEIKTAIADITLNLTDMRILFFIEASVMKYNLIPVTSSQIADNTGIDRGDASRSLKKLNNMNIIHPIKKMGHNQYYMANPDFIWRGEVKDRGFYVGFYWRLCNGLVDKEESEKYYGQSISETTNKTKGSVARQEFLK